MNPLQPGVESLGGWDGPRTLRVTVDGVEVAKTAITAYRVAHGIGSCENPDCDCAHRRYLVIEAEEADA